MSLDICRRLAYHRLDITISAEAEVMVNGWIGAVIRNNFLFAAGQVQVASEGVSLLTMLERYPLPEQHPLYTVLNGGFPKSFVISVHGAGNILSSRLRLQQDEKIVFSLILIGESSRFYPEFIEAVRLMCRRGLGTPRTPFRLHEIWEVDGWGRKARVAVGHMEKIAPLRFPVCWDQFQEERFGEKEKVVRLVLDSPLLLVVPAKKKDRTVSYQDKMNGFPSFYQFVRSAVFRCMRLSALYACPQEKEGYAETLEEIDSFLEDTASALLMKADIRWVRIPGPQRDDNRKPMLFSGYVGELVFVGDFSKYMPFLAFMQPLGNGNDTVYGLGHFQAEVLEYTKE